MSPINVARRVSSLDLKALGQMPPARSAVHLGNIEKWVSSGRGNKLDNLEALAWLKPQSPVLVEGLYVETDRVLKDLCLNGPRLEAVRDFSLVTQIGAYAGVPSPGIEILLDRPFLGVRQTAEAFAWDCGVGRDKRGVIEEIFSEHLKGLVHVHGRQGFLESLAVLRNIWSLSVCPFPTDMEGFARRQIEELCRIRADQEIDPAQAEGLLWMGRHPDRGLVTAPTGYEYLEDPIVLSPQLIEDLVWGNGASRYGPSRPWGTGIGPNKVKIRH